MLSHSHIFLHICNNFLFITKLSYETTAHTKDFLFLKSQETELSFDDYGRLKVSSKAPVIYRWC